MQIDIVQGTRVLRSINHEGQTFIEAPPTGEYQIQLYNNCSRRRMIVLSVDGINIIDGETADFKGPGYVLTAWQRTVIKGWRRSDSEVATFQFKPQEASYSNQTGRGTSNTGVIGVAVFEEKERPRFDWFPSTHVHHHHHYDNGGGFARTRKSASFSGHGSTMGGTFSSSSPRGGAPEHDSDGDTLNERINARAATKGIDSTGRNTLRSRVTLETMDLDMRREVADPQMSLCSDSGPSSSTAMPMNATSEPMSATLSSSVTPTGAMGGGACAAAASSDWSPSVRESVNLGTGYGEKAVMHTSTTTFERASDAPSLVITLRYAVREKLREWGVPVPTSPPPASAFPASQASVPAPPGWRG